MAQSEEAQNLFSRLIAGLSDRLPDSFAELIPRMIKDIFDNVEKQSPKPDRNRWHEWCDRLVSDGFCDQDTANLLKPLPDYPFPLGGIFWLLTILRTTMSDLEAVMEIYMLDRQYDSLEKTTPHPAPVEALVRAMIIDPGRATENRAHLKKHGYSDEHIDNIILAQYRTVDEGTLRMLYLRGIIDESRLYERMRELGYTDTRIREIVQTWEVIPGPQDLFTMVAKEAFEPDIYTRLGLADEFPTEQVEWLEKQGISRAWAEKFWIAHWDQPSIGQGFEMLHRGVINLDELDLLFRAVEIPSYWRDRLTQIAYSPYTRVDVRRMHDLGILSDEDLVRAYLDLGYDAEKALNMANFTIRYNASHEKELTRSSILESFREGLISRSEASGLLTDQGYSDHLADYYLTLEEYGQAKDTQKQIIDNIRDEYLLNIRSATAARDDLLRLGLQGDKVTALVDSWSLDRFKYQVLPSKGEIDRFLVKGIIDENHWREIMSRHGYTPEHIGWYLEDLRGEIELSRRMPTKADLEKWYSADLIDEGQYREYMSELGYSERFINLYLQSI